MKRLLSTALITGFVLSTSAFAAEPLLNKKELEVFHELSNAFSKDAKDPYLNAHGYCVIQIKALQLFLDPDYVQQLRALPVAKRGKDCWNYLHKKYPHIAKNLKEDIFAKVFTDKTLKIFVP